MNLEFKTVWSGDVHGPSRGMLCDAETVFPTRPPPLDGLPQRKKSASHAAVSVFQTARFRAVLLERAYTVSELGEKFGVSRSIVDLGLCGLRRAGILRSREVGPVGVGRRRKVYWVAA